MTSRCRVWLINLLASFDSKSAKVSGLGSTLASSRSKKGEEKPALIRQPSKDPIEQTKCSSNHFRSFQIFGNNLSTASYGGFTKFICHFDISIDYRCTQNTCRPVAVAPMKIRIKTPTPVLFDPDSESPESGRNNRAMRCGMPHCIGRLAAKHLRPSSLTDQTRISHLIPSTTTTVRSVSHESDIITVSQKFANSE